MFLAQSNLRNVSNKMNEQTNRGITRQPCPAFSYCTLWLEGHRALRTDVTRCVVIDGWQVRERSAGWPIKQRLSLSGGATRGLTRPTKDATACARVLRKVLKGQANYKLLQFCKSSQYSLISARGVSKQLILSAFKSSYQERYLQRGLSDCSFDFTSERTQLN
jgi:hypothetical protein